ncbi:UDP-N-acetylmuramate dehydrogenase [Colwelliaceae bacterium 6441]
MQRQFILTQHNSFAFPAVCPAFYQPSSLQELDIIIDELSPPFYILGEGSNTLFTEPSTTTILHPILKGIAVEEDNDCVFVTAKCGENWHQLVSFCVENGYYGLENLALIPGSVGAAPVQNIGAYGTELSSVIESVQWYEFKTKKLIKLDRNACQFSYRDSIFKHSLADKGVIVEVTFKLSKLWQANLSYQGLDLLAKNATAMDVFQQVIAIRQAKLPDPLSLPNAGSFFKNPIVDNALFKVLIKLYPEMPSYPQANEKVKLAAGWLIEKAGMKGFTVNEVGVDKNQALVLVNYASKKGQDIVKLAHYVQKVVQEKFDIVLEPEVRMLSSNGLTQL